MGSKEKIAEATNDILFRAAALNECGFTISEIAKQLDISEIKVKRLLRKDNNDD